MTLMSSLLYLKAAATIKPSARFSAKWAAQLALRTDLKSMLGRPLSTKAPVAGDAEPAVDRLRNKWRKI